MSNRVKSFKVNVTVPEWGYCNNQKDNNYKDDEFCNFHHGKSDERSCKLFNKTLYSSYGWVKKCDICLAATPELL